MQGPAVGGVGGTVLLVERGTGEDERGEILAAACDQGEDHPLVPRPGARLHTPVGRDREPLPVDRHLDLGAGLGECRTEDRGAQPGREAKALPLRVRGVRGLRGACLEQELLVADGLRQIPDRGGFPGAGVMASRAYCSTSASASGSTGRGRAGRSTVSGPAASAATASGRRARPYAATRGPAVSNPVTSARGR